MREGVAFPWKNNQNVLVPGFAQVDTVGGATLQLQWVGFPSQWVSLVAEHRL